MEDDPTIIYSDLCREITRDGVTIRSLVTVLILTPVIRVTARRLLPSQGRLRMAARLSAGSVFRPVP
jgi:hypothetical protein